MPPILFIKATHKELLTRKDGVKQHYLVKDSEEAIKSSIEKGCAAMRLVVIGQQNLKHVMFRREFGWVDFPWGTEGDPVGSQRQA